MKIIVEVKNEILGDCVFWSGDAADIREIRNTPARQTAEKVVKDGVARACGMWRVKVVEEE